MSTLFYFRADATRYCIAGNAVARIVWMPALSSLDGVPAWYVGVLNLQGERIAVIDFSVWMGHAERQFSVKQKLLILKQDQRRVAIVIDDVEGLEEWSGELLPLEQNDEIQRLLGEVLDGDDIVMLVNTAALFESSQRWPHQAIRAAHWVQAASVDDAAVFQSRTHLLAKEVAPLGRDMRLAYAVVSTGPRLYAIDLDQVMEFCLLKHFTQLPSCPPALVGCMNLRGEIVAILDLGILLGLEPSPHDAQILVLQQGGKKFSVVIASIERLVVASDTNILKMPDQDGQHPLSDTLLRHNGEVTPILKLDAVLALFKPGQVASANL